MAVCVCSTLLVLVTGGGEGFWLSLPFTLLAASWAPNHARAALPASVITILAIAASRGNTPSLLAILVVVGGCVAVVRMLEAEFQRERHALRATAMRDPLTGVANRRAFGERLRYEIARHTRQQRRFAVIALDLDGFKAVNDRFGHQAGDELLREVASAINAILREQDTVARVGGDEFTVLAPETDREGGECLADRVEEAVAGVTTGISTLSASVGLAIFPDDAEGGPELLEIADAEAIAVKRERHGITQRAA
ncbi:MAG TPA: GGDEF domain-containing protein [Thermoleophilaceae bacterium]